MGARDVLRTRVEGVGPAVAAGAVGFFSRKTKNRFHVLNAHFVRRLSHFRVTVRIVENFSPVMYCQPVRMRMLLLGSRLDFVGLIGDGEIKLMVVAACGRREAALFDGVVNQVRRGNNGFPCRKSPLHGRLSNWKSGRLCRRARGVRRSACP